MLTLFGLLILMIQFNEVDYSTNSEKTERKIPEHDKYTTTSEFKKLAAGNYDKGSKQGSLATKNDIAGFVQKT